MVPARTVARNPLRPCPKPQCLPEHLDVFPSPGMCDGATSPPDRVQFLTRLTLFLVGIHEETASESADRVA